jgi:hypothetical protein
MSQKFQAIEDVFLVFLETKKGVHPNVQTVKKALSDNGFKTEHARDIAIGTALGRVVKTKEGKDNYGNNIKAISITRDGKSCWQLDRKRPDPNRKGKITSEWVASWFIERDAFGDDHVRSVDGSDDIKDAVAHAQITYDPGDITEIFKRTLRVEGNGAHMMRAGVWCVPTRDSALLSRLEKVMESCDRDLIVTVLPDTGASKKAVAKAILKSLEEEVAEHQTAVDGYDGAKTKQGVVDNLTDRVQQTRRLTMRVAGHLAAGKADEILASLKKIDDKCSLVSQAIKSNKQAGVGRRSLAAV